jgi:hypothetical protein
MCRGGTRACFHHSDFQSKNFSYAIFIVKLLSKNGLCMWISAYPFAENKIFWQPSTTLVNMRFCTHVPNSNKNKNMKSGNPYLCLKMVFLASKTLLSLSGAMEINFLFDFERYDLANNKEWVCKIWWTCRHRSYLWDLTVRSTKRVSNFGHFTLFSIGADLRQFWPKTHEDFRG